MFDLILFNAQIYKKYSMKCQLFRQNAFFIEFIIRFFDEMQF